MNMRSQYFNPLHQRTAAYQVVSFPKFLTSQAYCYSACMSFLQLQSSF